MADNLELLLEAERRGLLPDDKRSALAEARRRGIVPAAPVPMDAPQAPAKSRAEGAPLDQWAMLGTGARNLAQGAYRGLESIAQGGAQLTMRNPTLLLGGSIAESMGQPDPFSQARNSVDDQASRSAASFDASEAGQSFMGRVGQFGAEVAATAPLAIASLPAKGASWSTYLGRSGLAGAEGAALQPVTSGEFGQSKLMQLIAGGGAGAGFAGTGRGLMSIAERIGWSPNALAQLANVANGRANRGTFAQSGEDLASRTGVRLSPGQVSGSRVQTALENMSRQSIFSADIAAQADAKVADDAIAYINRMMDRISREPASSASVGDSIQLAAKASVGKVLARRDEVAQQQFGPIERALGGRQFIDYQNTRKTLDDLIRQYQGVPTPEADRIVAQATAMRDRLTGQHSLSDFQRTRGYYGRAVGGEGSVFDDVDRSTNQSVARRLYAAMADDLDASAARLDGSVGAGIVPAGFFNGQVQASGGLGKALRDANANYRRFSQLAEGVRSHPIARLFGRDIKVDGEDWFNQMPPEAVVNRLGSMQPSEVRLVRQYMEGADPEAWQRYKRLLVQNALDAAQTLPASYGSRQVPFNAATFLRTLGGDKPAKMKQLNELFSAEEMREIDDAFEVARRLGDRFGSNPSGTGPYNEVQSFLQSVRQRSVEALASTGGEALGLRKVANVMLHADGRRALIELSRLPPESRQAASLVGFLAGVMAGKSALQPHVPQREKEEQGRSGQGW